MSETVHYTGKVKLLAKGELAAIAYANKLLADKERPSGYVNKLEMLLNGDQYEKYEFTGQNLYEILEKEKLAEGDIFSMTPTETPDVFDFRFQYYNSGCSFGEALGESEKNIKL